MDLSKLTDDQLAAMAAGAQAPVSTPAPSADLSKYSDAELDTMASAHPLTITPKPAAPSTLAHVAGLGGRAVSEGIVGGLAGLPALLGDSFAGVGRDVAYGGKLALSKTGLVDRPDPANYYGSGSAFPISDAVGRAAEAAPDALGLPVPTTGPEKLGSSVVRALTGAGTGIGAGRALAGLGGDALGALGGFMAEKPVLQTASGLASDLTATGADVAGIGRKGSTGLGVAAGLIPSILAHGRSNSVAGRAADVRTAVGQDNAAARILQDPRTTNNPALAADRAETAPTFVPGSTPLGTVATGDTRLMQNDKFMAQFDAQHAPRILANNRARLDMLSDAGIDAGPGRANDFPNAGADQAFRDRADAHADTTLPGILRGAPNQSIMDLRQQMLDLQDPANPASTAAVAETARHVQGLMERGATRVRDEDGNLVDVRQTPELLARARNDVTQAEKGPATDTTAVAIQNARRELYKPGGMMSSVDNEIEAGAPGYQEYLAKQREIRGQADWREVGNKLVTQTTSAANNADGVPTIMGPAFLRDTKPANMDKRIVPGNRTRLSELPDWQGPLMSPQRAVQAVRADLQRDSLLNSAGIKLGEAKTADQGRFDTMVDEHVNRGVPAMTRAQARLGGIGGIAVPTTLGLATAGMAGAGMIAPAAIGALGVGTTALMRAASKGATNSISNARAGVQGVLGSARNDPATMARLLRLQTTEGKTYTPYVGNAAKQAARNQSLFFRH